MTLNVLSIDDVLLQSGARRYGIPGCANDSKNRLEVSKFIVNNYSSFDKLRLHLFNHQNRLITASDQQRIKEVAHYFCRLGWIKTGPNSSFKISDTLNENIIRYMRGQWLEEYVYEAFTEAGADEAYYGQRIIWGSNHAPSYFEIDVIARKSNLIFFVTCKAIKTEHEQGKSSALRQFISETLTWKELLSAGKARIMVVTTADMIDENESMKHRYQNILEQAEALDQKIIGFEELKWPHFTTICKNLLDSKF